MTSKLVVAVIGNRHAGKSSTWYELFGRMVQTRNRVRRLYLNETEWVEVFLVNGSPQERHIPVEDIIGDADPTIVLCSMQYLPEAVQTIDYFLENDYGIFAHWLNPGHSDPSQQADTIPLVPYLLEHGATVAVRDGQVDVQPRVREVRDVIYGWASSRGLIRSTTATAAAI